MTHDLSRITIRNTTLDDIVPLRTMHGKSWRDTYPNKEHGVSKEWVEQRTAAWLTPEGIAGSIEHSQAIYGKPEHFHQIALDGDTVVGIVHASKLNGKQHLAALYVDSAYKGTGLAHQLMQRAFDWFDLTKPVDLEVAIYNDRAKAFYKKYGFEEVPGTEELFAEVIPVITMVRKGDER